MTGFDIVALDILSAYFDWFSPSAQFLFFTQTLSSLYYHGDT